MNVINCHIHLWVYYTTVSTNVARHKRLIYYWRAYKTCYPGKRYSENTSRFTLTLPHQFLTRKNQHVRVRSRLCRYTLVHAFNRHTTTRHDTVIRFSFFNMSKNFRSRRFVHYFRRYKDKQSFSTSQQSLKNSRSKNFSPSFYTNFVEFRKILEALSNFR